MWKLGVLGGRHLFICANLLVSASAVQMDNSVKSLAKFKLWERHHFFFFCEK